MIESRVRMSIVGVIVLALFCALFARLWYLQVAATSDFAAAAQSNSVRVINEPPIRGRILDAKGRPLVENRIANVITIDRQLSAEKRDMVVNRLAELLAVPPKDIRERLDDPRVSPYTPVPVAVDVTVRGARVRERAPRGLPGRAGGAASPMRSYVNGKVGAHVLGYVGRDQRRRAHRAAARMRATSSATRSARAASSSPSSPTCAVSRVPTGSRSTAPDGSSARSRPRRRTPGHDVQAHARPRRPEAGRGLAQPGDRVGASDPGQGDRRTSSRSSRRRRGAAVVLDATNGSVVAMASYPEFDPNRFVNGIPTADWEQLNDPAGNYPLVDRAISGQYAPGSTFKLITAIAGLQSGAITANKTINDRGKYAYPTDPDNFFTNDNEAVYGRVDLPRALTVSSDVYFYTIGGDLFYRQRHAIPGGEAIQETARAYGFGKPTGVGLPNESTGRVPDAAWKQKVYDENPEAFPFPDWLPGNNIQLAVGQGDVLVTPLQLANAYAAFANGGTLREPRLASEVLDARGKKVRDLAPITIGQVPVPDRERHARRVHRCRRGRGRHRVQRVQRVPAGLDLGQDRHRAGGGQAEHVVVRRHDPGDEPASTSSSRSSRRAATARRRRRPSSGASCRA